MASRQHDSGSDSVSEDTSLLFRASRNLFEKLEVSTAKIQVQAEVEAQALGLRPKTGGSSSQVQAIGLRPRTGLRIELDDGGSSSLASSYDDSDKDKTIQPSNLTDDSSETRVHRHEARLAKRKRILTPKKQKKYPAIASKFFLLLYLYCYFNVVMIYFDFYNVWTMFIHLSL